METYVFDNTNPYWSNDKKEYNGLFLRAQQCYFNDKLHAYGFVDFNDVLKQLGFPVDDSLNDWRWVLDEEDGPVFVDFGIEEDMGTGFYNLYFNIEDGQK